MRDRRRGPAAGLPPREVRRFLERYRRYLVLGHLEPDGDCLASQIALASLLRAQGKEAELFSPGPFDRPEIVRFRDRFRSAISAQEAEGSVAAVLLDCSTPDRLGSLEEAIRGLPVLVIDHHASGTPFGFEEVRWVVPEVPSVTCLIQRLWESYRQPIPAQEAQLLLFGLCTDTGFFRHLGETDGPIFEAVSRLVDAGASAQRVHRMLNSGWSLDRVGLIAKALGRARRVLEGRVLLTCWTFQDLHGESVAARGSDDIYRLLQSVEGIEVVVFLRQEAQGRCSVGLRSAGQFDVGQLARALGGGGHARAAGCTLAGELPQVREKVMGELFRRLQPAQK